MIRRLVGRLHYRKTERASLVRLYQAASEESLERILGFIYLNEEALRRAQVLSSPGRQPRNVKTIFKVLLQAVGSLFTGQLQDALGRLGIGREVTGRPDPSPFFRLAHLVNQSVTCVQRHYYHSVLPLIGDLIEQAACEVSLVLLRLLILIASGLTSELLLLVYLLGTLI